jgi:hypothetical protein
MNDDERHLPEVLVQEAASLFYLLGGIGPKHLVIVGGMVPPLLVPDALEAHVGSTDIDLCLSVAITEGATREYYKSIEEMISPYFNQEGSSGFRWRKKEDVFGVPLLLDFLGPSDEWQRQTADGTRPLESQTAAENAGINLRPFPIRSGTLVDRDAESRKEEGVQLVYDPGVRADINIRFAGPVGFLAAKADALNGRKDSKDGYDVSWWCLNAAGTPDRVADLVTTRPSFKDEIFQETVSILNDAFRERDYPGPSGYAAEACPNSGPGDEDYEQARNRAFAAVSKVVEVLKGRLW